MFNAENIKITAVVEAEEAIINARNEFKAARKNAVEHLTVTMDGVVYDADEASQNRMLRPIATLNNDTDTWLWVAHDNSVMQLTRPQFIELLTLAGTAQTALWVQP